MLNSLLCCLEIFTFYLLIYTIAMRDNKEKITEISDKSELLIEK